jgi:hypothetical protein
MAKWPSNPYAYYIAEKMQDNTHANQGGMAAGKDDLMGT